MVPEIPGTCADANKGRYLVMEDRGIKRGTRQTDWRIRHRESIEGALDSHRDDRTRAPAQNQSEKLFLIVEDDQNDFILLERALRHIDGSTPISWAQDGAEAIDALPRLSPQFSRICMVVDIQLTDMNGFELVQYLKAKNLCHGVIFVFVTGNPNPRLKTVALACGADAFFLKPSRHSEFLNMARELNEVCAREKV